MAAQAEEIEVAGRAVRLTSRDRVIFPARGFTKGDVFDYYLAVGEGIMRALGHRPTTLQRFPEGIDGEMFFQKRVPQRGVPPWIHSATISFPSGRKADELCPVDLAHVDPFPQGRRHSVRDFLAVHSRKPPKCLKQLGVVMEDQHVAQVQDDGIDLGLPRGTQRHLLVREFVLSRFASKFRRAHERLHFGRFVSTLGRGHSRMGDDRRLRLHPCRGWRLLVVCSPGEL